MSLLLFLCFPLCSPTFILCITGSLLSSSLLSFRLPRSSTSLSLSFLFPGFSLSNTTSILSGSSLCLSFLLGKLSLTFLTSLLSGSSLSLCLSTSLSTGNLLSNHLINLSIKGSIFLTLLFKNALDGLLLLLKRVYHILLFCLFVFKSPLLLLIPYKKGVFLFL